MMIPSVVRSIDKIEKRRNYIYKERTYDRSINKPPFIFQKILYDCVSQWFKINLTS